jgi:hypothetical protein
MAKIICWTRRNRNRRSAFDADSVRVLVVVVLIYGVHIVVVVCDVCLYAACGDRGCCGSVSDLLALLDVFFTLLYSATHVAV